jgi:hypothetical protein
MTRLAAALAALAVLLPTTASAQPPAGHEAPPAPPPRGDLSHIDGVPVPVGDHNQYYYDFRRWNVASNPIGWIAGIYGLSVSYGFHDNVALRGDANLYSLKGGDSGYEVGVGLPIYFRRTYQGVFLEPGLIVREFENSSSPTMGPQVLVGWHWTWDSGLNVAVAGGLGRNFAASDRDFSGDDLFANGYLRFGYSF